MGSEIQLQPQAVTVGGMIRPRSGAVAGPDGQYAPADLEAVISLRMVCIRAGGLVGPDGKQVGVLAPVGEVSRPYLEVIEDARSMFAMGDQAEGRR